MNAFRSYTSTGGGPAAFAREAVHLWRRQRDPAARVEQLLRQLHDVERAALRHGLVLSGKRVLDLGSGQLLGQLAWFARANDAVGVDLDVIPQDHRPGTYLRMLRANGPRRTLKTAARTALGVDARFRAELTARIGPIDRLDVRRMDAARLELDAESFDFVHCESLLQHVPEPRRVLREIRRVLRPGGVCYLHWHLYTSANGSLDPRAASDGFPRWAHLRPALADRLHPAAYLNRLRLHEWRELLDDVLPGAEVELRQPRRAATTAAARALQASGELAGYELDELVTHSVAVVWQKP